VTRRRIMFLAPALLGLICVGAAAPFLSWRASATDLAADAAALRELPESIGFNAHVRPILVAKCFRCHGSDPGARKAELRLDLPEHAFGPRADGRSVIVPGDPAASRVVERIRSTDPDEMMPPPESNETLEPRAIAILERWIAEGAEYEPHWAFIPPERPPLPPLGDTSWPQNAIDRFVLARLEAEELAPNPVEDPRRLIRRVTLDLTGLPPTPDEVEAFVSDSSPDAYESLVERLLARPAYGEHRARYWLDYVRYADTHGYHFDNYRSIWPYRDWVIDAFNANQPFDRFTIEQIAGDMLPEPTREQLVATGFVRAGMSTNEGGTIPEENLAIYATDRVETTSQVWLGLTLGCARCHDHKFDPVSTQDFYRMAAFFRNTTQPAMDENVHDSPPILRIPKPADARRYRALPRQIAAAEKAYEDHVEATAVGFRTWQRQQGPEQLPGEDVEALEMRLVSGTRQGASLRDLAGEGRIHSVSGAARKVSSPFGPAFRLPAGAHADLGDVGDVESHEAFSFGAWVQVGESVYGSLLARVDEENGDRGWELWLKGSRAGARLSSSWNRDALSVVVGDKVPSEGWHHVFVTYDGSRSAEGLRVFYDGEVQFVYPEADWLRGPIGTDTPLRLNRRSRGGGTADVAVHDVRFYRRELAPREVRLLARRADLESALATPPVERSEEQLEVLRGYHLDFVDEEAIRLERERVALEAELEAIEERSLVTLIVEEKDDEEPFAHVLIRGQYDQLGERVGAGVPEALPPLPEGAGANRLGLAQWLVDPGHPLTARVNVNRFWAQVFGAGLVPTPGDFGTTGEPATHPELLDWLAVEFRESGWDVKALFRIMVTSAAYRQSAAGSPEKLAGDPENRLLSRGPRFRMDGEMIRDLALASSGLLSPKRGGPSVKPYQPLGVWEAVAMEESNTKVYFADSGESLYRRSLYTFWKRAAPPPAMETFDAPTREECAVSRERTNTPLQALVTLNDVQFVEAARQLAQVAIRVPGKDDAARLDAIARRVLSRHLEAEERSDLAPVIAKLRERYAGDTGAAAALLEVGESPHDEAIPAPELAAWTMVASQFLNLDEALTK